MANLFSQMAHSAIGDMTLNSHRSKSNAEYCSRALTSYLPVEIFIWSSWCATTEALQNILRDVKDPTVKQLIVSIAVCCIQLSKIELT
ncbi:MAG: hypothetical protein ACLRXQ_04585 [Phascolarctobacterium faecium]